MVAAGALLLAVTAVLGGIAPGGAATPVPVAAAAATAPMRYSLALGDSLAAGMGASTLADDYVNVLAQSERHRYPGLQVENLACSGATTTSMLHGPGCSYASGTQEGDAEAFLRAHPGQVAFITIDIGANDVDGCISLQSGSVNLACVSQGMAAIEANLPQILDGLHTAAPHVPLIAMNYYDPFLAYWLAGSAGQALARESESLALQLNDRLTWIYAATGDHVADVQSRFQTTNFAMTGSYQGQVIPQNVSLICQWTLMCAQANIHANDSGHAQIAQTFHGVVSAIVGPPVSATAGPLPAAVLTRRYHAVLTASHGTAPYRWAQLAGSLPPGITLAPNGVLSGEPRVRGIWAATYRVIDAVGATATTTRPIRVHWPTALSRNQGLRPGQRLVAGRFQLVQQANGNLVEYQGSSTKVWTAHTGGHPGARTIFQGDGNLVVYSARGVPLWASGTARSAARNCVLRPVTGAFQLTAGPGRIVWQAA